MIKKTLTTGAVIGALFLLTGCETTGNKRVNGSNSEHVNAKLKHVTIYGSLTIGGAEQITEKASQEGLGRVDAEANAEASDSLNGNTVAPELPVVPAAPEAPAAE